MGILWSLCTSKKSATELPISLTPRPAFPLCEHDRKPVFCKSLKCTHTLCQKCEIESYMKKICISCTRDLDQEELRAIEHNFKKPCSYCNTSSICFQLTNCKCFICLNCQSNNISNNLRICKCSRKINLNDFSVSVCSELSQSQYFCGIGYECLPRGDMITLDCDHYFCKNCLQGHIISYFKDNWDEVYKGIGCPECRTKINGHTIQASLAPEQFDQYTKIMLSKTLTECPKCKFVFESLKKYIICPKCKHNFCINCKQKEKKCTCSEHNQFEIDGTAQCPGCKTAYFKNEGCDHVKCPRDDCGIEFCFNCCAPRDPTMNHGNHYHRPDCPFYAPLGDSYKDKYDPKCQMCRKFGELCKRPKSLKIPKRFQDYEI